MTKVLKWLALLVFLAGVVALVIKRILASPYASEILSALAVATACGLVAFGLVIGAVWTFMMMKHGARLAGPGYVAGEQSEAARLRALREGLRVFTGQSLALPASAEQPQPWLPPLQPFEAEFEEIGED